MKEYKCIKSCYPFVEGDICKGREIIFHVCGTVIESYEMNTNDGYRTIVVPTEYFEEIK